MMDKLLPYRVLLAACTLACGARASQLLVETATFSASGEALRTSLHLVDVDSGQAIPGPVAVPSRPVPGGLVLVPGGEFALVSLSPAPPHLTASFRAREWMLVKTAPLQRITQGTWQVPESGWMPADALFLSVPGGVGGLMVLLDGNRGPGPAHPGRLALYPSIRRDGTVSRDVPLVSRWLDAIPLQGVALGNGTRVAILGENPSSGEAVLDVRDAVSGAADVSGMLLPQESDQLGSRPAGMALSGDGAYLFLLTSGYALDRPSGEETSWLHALSTADFEAVGDPVRLPGAARVGGSPLHPLGARGCMAMTHEAGSAFAYVTQVRVEEEGIEMVSHVPYSGVTSPLQVAAGPDGERMAIAAENRLGIFRGGQKEVGPLSYAAGIGALAWREAALYVGEGGRVRAIDPDTGRDIWTVQLQTGLVSAIVPLPGRGGDGDDGDGDGLSNREEKSLGTSPESADSDGDSIPDGADPEPAVPSPALSLPPSITFHGEAVDREIRSLVLDPAFGGRRAWRLEYDEASMPWLRVHPRRGTTPHFIHMGVDASSYNPAPGEWVTGHIWIHLEGVGDAAAAGSPARVELRIAPDRNRVRRILWMFADDGQKGPMRGGGDPLKVSALANMLAAPPFRFSHEEIQGPANGSLDDYTIVVLDVDAAARGALTRQALLEYVAGGGALLLLGKYGGGASADAMSRWLSPLGIHIFDGAAVNGTFQAGGGHELTAHWKDFSVRGGTVFQVEDQESILVAEPAHPNGAVLSFFSHGLGRVAVLASMTPLQSPAMSNPSNRRFAADLFQWLSRARQEIHDQDGDGLPDSIEGRNLGGRVDFSKTDHLQNDTDGDGIPDSLEDVNRNGWVDEGETNPVNPDTDGDGIFDGADAHPLPPMEAPYVAEVEGPQGPAEGPGEGGSYVTLIGRNFLSDTGVWFGDRRSSAVRRIDTGRLLALTPPADSFDGGIVDVRVVNEREGLEGMLPSGFRYLPTSVVKLVLRSIATAQMAYTVYDGQVRIALEADPGLAIGLSGFHLRVDPSGAVHTVQFTPSPEARRHGWRVVANRLGRGLYRVGVSGGAPPYNLNEIATLRWIASLDGEHPALSFSIERPAITTRNGALLPLESNTVEIRISDGAPSVRHQNSGRVPPPG